MQVSFLLYIIPWRENKSEKENRSKNKNDFLVAVAHFIEHDHPFNPFQLALIKTIAAMPVQACDWLTS